MHINLKIVVMICLVLSFSFGKRENKIPVVENLSLNTDGKLNENDWQKALVFKLSDSNKLLLIQNKDNIFIGIDNNEKVLRYTDIFINTNGTGEINVHASMQLGERKLIRNWNDTIPKWNWGNNKDWTANKLLLRGKDLQNLSKSEYNNYNDYEFKISKEKLSDKILSIYMEIKYMYGVEKNVCFPDKIIRHEVKYWKRVRL